MFTEFKIMEYKGKECKTQCRIFSSASRKPFVNYLSKKLRFYTFYIYRMFQLDFTISYGNVQRIEVIKKVQYRFAKIAIINEILIVEDW